MSNYVQDCPVLSVDAGQVRKARLYCVILETVAALAGVGAAIYVVALGVMQGNNLLAFGVGAGIVLITALVVAVLSWLSSVLALLSVIEYNTRRRL